MEIQIPEKVTTRELQFIKIETKFLLEGVKLPCLQFCSQCSINRWFMVWIF